MTAEGEEFSGSGSFRGVSEDRFDPVSPEAADQIVACADATIVTEWVLVNSIDEQSDAPDGQKP